MFCGITPYLFFSWILFSCWYLIVISSRVINEAIVKGMVWVWVEGWREGVVFTDKNINLLYTYNSNILWWGVIRALQRIKAKFYFINFIFLFFLYAFLYIFIYIYLFGVWDGLGQWLFFPLRSSAWKSSKIAFFFGDFSMFPFM